MKSDAEILDWLEKHLDEYLLVPPKMGEKYWSIYLHGHEWVATGATIRACVSDFLEKSEIMEMHRQASEAVATPAKTEFTLTDVEQKNLQAFKDKMLLKYRREGSYEFIFTPTGVGYAVTARRKESKDECNITDYESW